MRFRLACVFVFVACRAPAPPPLLRFAPCMLRDAQGTSPTQAECARLEVPEDWSKPSGKQITLAVARLAPMLGRPLPDPLLLVPGGPGQSAMASFTPLLPALAEINRRRALVLVDPRGTGESSPLRCSVPFPEGDSDEARDVAAVLACKDKLSGDPRHYHTEAEVKDLEAVRKAMGVDRWNVYGISYGTRVALTYLRLAPAALRSVVLDGVVPQDLVLGSTHQATAEAALAALGERAHGFPALVPSLLALKERLTRAPVQLESEEPRTATAKRERLDGARLVGIVRLALYAPEASALLPLAVREALEGRYERLLHLSALTSANLGALNPLLNFTVGCREDVPFARDALEETPFFGFGVMRVLREVCAGWPAERGAEPAPVSSLVPALLFSGELDPVTPPAFGERAAKTLGVSRHVEVKGTGHGTLARGCVPRLVGEFLDKPNPAVLDVSCLEPLRPFPLFTTAVGP